MELNRKLKNLAARELGSLCQFVQTEEARVAVEGQVTGDLTDHTYVTVISLIPPAAEGMDIGYFSLLSKSNAVYCLCSFQSIYFREMNTKGV